MLRESRSLNKFDWETQVGLGLFGLPINSWPFGLLKRQSILNLRGSSPHSPTDCI